MHHNSIENVMKNISVALILMASLVAGCDPDKVNYDSSGHRFDNQVIGKLPVYDSLTRLLTGYFPLFQKELNGENSYRFTRKSDSSMLRKTLSEEGTDSVMSYFNLLGENYIYGFQIYRDTSLKIIVKDTYLKEHSLYVTEQLSFYPSGGKMRKREAPNKDTVLNRHWQYWISFEEQDGFGF